MNWRTLGVNGLLVGQLLKHLGGTSQSITRLTNATVDDHLVNLQLTHRVLRLIFLGRHGFNIGWNVPRQGWSMQSNDAGSLGGGGDSLCVTCASDTVIDAY